MGTDSISIVIPVEGPVIKRDESNEAIIGSLLDCVKLLHFYEKLLSRWIKKFTKFGGRCAEGSVKEAIDLKARVALELERLSYHLFSFISQSELFVMRVEVLSRHYFIIKCSQNSDQHYSLSPVF